MTETSIFRVVGMRAAKKRFGIVGPDLKFAALLMLALLSWHPDTLASTCAHRELVQFEQGSSILMLIRAGPRVPHAKATWLRSAGGRGVFEFETIEVFKGEPKFDRLWSEFGMFYGPLSQGTFYLVAPNDRGGLNMCGSLEIGSAPDQDPWIRVLRARAGRRIDAVTNPWRFIDKENACYLDHRLDYGYAGLTFRYRYGPEPSGDEIKYWHWPAYGFERLPATETAGTLETRVYATGSQVQEGFRVEVGGDAIEARHAPLVKATNEFAELIDEHGTRRLLRALRYGDGSGLRLSWKRAKQYARQDSIDRIQGESEDMVASTDQPFFDGALAEFKRCLRRNFATGSSM